MRLRSRSRRRSQRARPKSIRKTRPARSSMRFDGLMSRWSTACRRGQRRVRTRASAAWMPIRPRRERALRVTPAQTGWTGFRHGHRSGSRPGRWIREALDDGSKVGTIDPGHREIRVAGHFAAIECAYDVGMIEFLESTDLVDETQPVLGRASGSQSRILRRSDVLARACSWPQQRAERSAVNPPDNVVSPKLLPSGGNNPGRTT